MDDLATGLAIVGMIATVVFVGFLIVLIVGLIIKKKAPKTVGKIGMVITAVFMLIGLGGGRLAGMKANEQRAREEAIQKAKEKKENKAFNDASSAMVSDVYSVVSKSETTAQAIHDGWGDAIDASSDDFDVNTVVQGLVDKNATTIAEIKVSLLSAKNKLSEMEKNDTGKYDLAFYKNLYKHTEKLADFIYSPAGSYSDYIDKFNARHEKIDDDLSELSD